MNGGMQKGKINEDKAEKGGENERTNERMTNVFMRGFKAERQHMMNE